MRRSLPLLAAVIALFIMPSVSSASITAVDIAALDIDSGEKVGLAAPQSIPNGYSGLAYVTGPRSFASIASTQSGYLTYVSVSVGKRVMVTGERIGPWSEIRFNGNKYFAPTVQLVPWVCDLPTWRYMTLEAGSSIFTRNFDWSHSVTVAENTPVELECTNGFFDAHYGPGQPVGANLFDQVFARVSYTTPVGPATGYVHVNYLPIPEPQWVRKGG